MITTNIIKDTKDLRKFTRLNAAVAPDTWRPGVPEAKQQLAFYISAELLEEVESFAKTPTETKTMTKLLPYVQFAMAPMIMLNISAEMSMSIGDRGHSVLKDDNSLPASETKIQNYENALKTRISHATEQLLAFLEQNLSDYPNYEKSEVYKRRLQCICQSATEITRYGNVRFKNIHLAYETLREGIIRAQERYIVFKTGQELMDKLLQNKDLDKTFAHVKMLIARVCTNRAVAQYLKANGNNLEPLGIAPGDYSGDADAFFDQFKNYLVDNAEQLGVTIYKATEFNNPEQKVFSAIL